MDTVTGSPDVSSLFRLSHQGVAVAVRLATEPDGPAVVHDVVDDRGGMSPSPNASPHRPNSRFVVNTTLRLS